MEDGTWLWGVHLTRPLLPTLGLSPVCVRTAPESTRPHKENAAHRVGCGMKKLKRIPEIFPAQERTGPRQFNFQAANFSMQKTPARMHALRTMPELQIHHIQAQLEKDQHGVCT